MPSALLLQGGGPTPVVNASLYGVWAEMRKGGGSGGRLWGSKYGLKGLLAGAVLDLSAESPELMAGIRLATGAALGSSRAPLPEGGFERILQTLRKLDIQWLFFNGGNGSMGTALEIQSAALAAGLSLQVIGIPKTVDNDLLETDHTPGYASAGRFWAHAVRDMGMDHRALPSPILITEVIGRNVGWIVAATALARYAEDDAPHLIYCPERPLPRARLLADIEAVYRRIGRVFVVMCEGQLDENGNAFDADVDRPGNPQHRLASNLAHAVARFVARELKLRTRSERPSLLGRSSALTVPELDREEAEECGRAAVRAATQEEQGQMVALRRESSIPYRSSTLLVPLAAVARRERQMPKEFYATPGAM